jgi:hypothetical protein
MALLPANLFTWRRLVAQGVLTAAGSGEEIVPASDYRALQSQVRQRDRLLGKKTPEVEILKEALEYARGQKEWRHDGRIDGDERYRGAPTASGSAATTVRRRR